MPIRFKIAVWVCLIVFMLLLSCYIYTTSIRNRINQPSLKYASVEDVGLPIFLTHGIEGSYSVYASSFCVAISDSLSKSLICNSIDGGIVAFDDKRDISRYTNNNMWVLFPLTFGWLAVSNNGIMTFNKHGDLINKTTYESCVGIENRLSLDVSLFPSDIIQVSNDSFCCVWVTPNADLVIVSVKITSTSLKATQYRFIENKSVYPMVGYLGRLIEIDGAISAVVIEVDKDGTYALALKNIERSTIDQETVRIASKVNWSFLSFLPNFRKKMSSAAKEAYRLGFWDTYYDRNMWQGMYEISRFTVVNRESVVFPSYIITKIDNTATCVLTLKSSSILYEGAKNREYIRHEYQVPVITNKESKIDNDLVKMAWIRDICSFISSSN